MVITPTICIIIIIIIIFRRQNIGLRLDITFISQDVLLNYFKSYFV
jgi:hypothetical protein